jgi:hypothetical protein
MENISVVTCASITMLTTLLHAQIRNDKKMTVRIYRGQNRVKWWFVNRNLCFSQIKSASAPQLILHGVSLRIIHRCIHCIMMRLPHHPHQCVHELVLNLINESTN